MNRYTLYIASSIFFIIMPIVLIWYGYWDASQPKVGPVGNGVKPPAFQQLLPLYSTLLMGLGNLPIAIVRYREHKKRHNFDDN